MKTMKIMPAGFLVGLFIIGITWQAIDAQSDEYQKEYNLIVNQANN